jgi:hypothetical protein
MFINLHATNVYELKSEETDIFGCSGTCLANTPTQQYEAE